MPTEGLVADVAAAVAAAYPAKDATPAPAAVEKPADPVENPIETPVEGETPAEEPAAKVEDDKPAAKPAKEVVEEPEEPTEFEKEHGIKAKTADGRENRLPHSRVVKITENAVKKVTSTLKEAHAAELKQRDDHIARFGEVEQVMFNDPDSFLEVLKTIPGYAERLKPAAPVQTHTNTPPPPDAENADGSKGYSPAGLQALLDWVRTDAVEQATAKAEARIAKRYEPLEKTFKQQQADAEFERVEGPKIQAKLKDARDNWEGYKEHEAAIQALYLSDKTLTLKEAWATHMLGQKKSDRASLWKEFLAEQAKAPKGTAISTAPVSAASKTTETEPATAEEAVRAALKKQGLLK